MYKDSFEDAQLAIYVWFQYLCPYWTSLNLCSFFLFLSSDHLIFQATWHKGHSLAQTVYSCLYLLRPERTSSHALLHSYCQIMRATCKAVLSVVADARTHEVMYSNCSLFLSLFCRIIFLLSLVEVFTFFLLLLHQTSTGFSSFWRSWLFIELFLFIKFHRMLGLFISLFIYMDLKLFYIMCQ